MAVSVRKATEDDLYKVYQLLSNSTLNSAWLPLEARAEMFKPVWGGNEGYYGYLLEDGDEVVGFLGTLFTEREVHGARQKFCELHSWYVKEAYRQESMKLFFPVMSIRNATLLNYTPTKTVYGISRKFGFADLETRIRMFLPVPTPRTFSSSIRVERKKHIIIQYLNERDRQIFLDHAKAPCRHFLIHRKGRLSYSYLIVKKLWLRRYVPFGRILYASDKKALFENIDYLRFYLSVQLGVPFVVMDEDEIDTGVELAFTRTTNREVPSLYKSRQLTPEDLRPPLYTLPLLLGYRLH